MLSLRNPILFVVIFVIAVTLGQENKKSTGTFKKKLPVRIGPDGRPLLFGPKMDKCQKSKN